MSTSNVGKLAVGVIVGGLFVGTALWLMGEEEPAEPLVARQEPPEASEPEPAAHEAGPTEPERAAEPKAAQKKRWEGLRAKISARRAKREDPSDPPSVLGDEDPDDAVAEVEKELAQARALGPVINDVLEQGVPLFIECLDLLPETGTGKLHLKANVIGEPDVGGIVDSVDVVDDSLDQPEFRECLQQSTYAISMEDIKESMTRSIDIDLDMDERTLQVGTEMDFDRFAQLHEQQPELWDKMLTDPDVRSNLAELLKQPGFVEQNPDLAAAIEAGLADPPA